MNIGVLLATLAVLVMAPLPRHHRIVFLVGVIPAFVVLWIRRRVPETEEWYKAQRFSAGSAPGFIDLFRGNIRRLTGLILLVCALTLTAHWAFLFWSLQELRKLPGVPNGPSRRR